MAGHRFSPTISALRREPVQKSRRAGAAMLALSVIGMTTPQVAEAQKHDEHSRFREANHSEYQFEVVVEGLTYPTSVEFDDRGRMYIAEAGYAYGDPIAPARILRVDLDGAMHVFVDNLNGPVNDLLWHNGGLYISHRGVISRATNDGARKDLVTELPSFGDHQNNQLSVGPDGKLYFGQGTATNSGLVGLDNYKMGWLPAHPDAHDIPAHDIQIRDRAFETTNPLTLAELDEARTSPFHPFSKSAAGSVTGATKANGVILRCDTDGSNLEVYAWGLRNPYGVLWAGDGNLYATENGFDVRGSRPIANDYEDLYQIKKGAWYGWPDYASGRPVTEQRFHAKDHPAPEFLMQEHPPVEAPLATFPPHAAISKMDWSANPDFGFDGHLIIAFWGHMTPMTGAIEGEHGGHRVMAFDPSSRNSITLVQATHGHGKSGHGESSSTTDDARSQPERGHEGHEPMNDKNSEKSSGGDAHAVVSSDRLERPIDVRFSPDGTALYVVDFGRLEVDPSRGPTPYPTTGRVWRLTRRGLRHEGPPANRRVDPTTFVEFEIEPDEQGVKP